MAILKDFVTISQSKMAYANYFDPGDWDEGKATVFKSLIMEGCQKESPEVQAAWNSICDKMIEIVWLFRSVQLEGITQVLFAGNNAVSENKQQFQFRVTQRNYGQQT